MMLETFPHRPARPRPHPHRPDYETVLLSAQRGQGLSITETPDGVTVDGHYFPGPVQVRICVGSECVAKFTDGPHCQILMVA